MSKRMLIYWIIVVIFLFCFFNLQFFDFSLDFFVIVSILCMTANRTVNAIILVQRGLRLREKILNVNFFFITRLPPPPPHTNLFLSQTA